MARERMSLSQFGRYALPALQKRFGRDPEKINRAIANEFSIFDPDSKNAPVKYMVGYAQHDGDEEPRTEEETREFIAKVLREEINKSNKALKPPFAPIESKSMSTSTRYGQTNNFKGADAIRKAERWGMFALAAAGGNRKAMGWLEDNSIPLTRWTEEMEAKSSSGHYENINTIGGFIVPEILDSDIIDLRLEYGVFRRNANIRPMVSDNLSRPRRKGGLTAYFVGEGAQGTGSRKNWDQVQLVAKKIMILTKISSELNEDAVINIGDDLAGEIAYAFSFTEDGCGFIGDATSTYGGIFGISPKLININGVDDGGGLVLASGNAWSEITLADFRKVIARVPSYARKGAKWYVSPTFHDSVMQTRLDAAGGNTIATLMAGGGPQFLGYPVELTEVMPTSEANSQVCALFGNLQKSSSFGDRRQTTITFSQSGAVDGVDVFTTDELAVRGTQRFDIVNHDLGDATTAGPVVGLITAAA